MEKSASVFMLTVLLVSLVIFVIPIQIAESDPATWIVPDDYSTIQEAINASSTQNGDTILVMAGTYNENILVNKELVILGEGTDSTIVNGSAPDKPVFYITANHTVIRDLKITSSPQSDHGIYIRKARYVNIIDCEVSSNRYGIFLYRANNTLLANCTISNSTTGIRMNHAEGNTLENLTVHSIKSSGIGTSFTENTLISNCNTSKNEGAGIDIYNSINITIVGSISALNKDSYVGRGIRIYGSSYCNISKNLAFSNEGYGIFFDMSSTNNLVKENKIISNSYGIHMSSSVSNNTLFHNNFINNTVQVDSVSSTNIWDDGYPSGGNYWSDYAGVDWFNGEYQNETGSDGIGDSPYVDDDVMDYYPLMKPYPWDAHDLGLTRFESPSFIVQGYELQVTVTLVNYGSNPETFNVTAYANSTTIEGSVIGILTSRNITSLSFTLNTTEFAPGTVFELSAIVDSVLGEVDIGDNVLVFGWVLITISGDVDGNGKVDIFDIVMIALSYGSIIGIPEPGIPEYDPACDIDGDGDVDIFDIVLAAGNYGTVYP